jgi:CRP/FNR family transcriptional regulator, anaerobic regulatory protein
MTTTKRLVGISRDVDGIPARGSTLREVVPSHVEFGPVELDLRAATSLRYALECSQMKLAAAQQQVALLTESIARLTRRAIEREREITFPQHAALPEVSRTATLHEVSRGGAQGSPWKGSDFCLFEGLDHDATAHVEQLLTHRIRLRRGEVLYRAGGRFNALYAIRTGWCKTLMLARDGREQVAGFYMSGEIIGLDGISADTYECQATVLEDTEVSQLAFDDIERLAHRNGRFQQNLHRLLTHRYARARNLMFLLGSLSADQRLAVFLLDLSQRYRTRGYSPSEFVLRMTREEIGSYLGLTLETVSRVFSQFKREGLMQIEGRIVNLLDRVALKRIVDGTTARENCSDPAMTGLVHLLGSA